MSKYFRIKKSSPLLEDNLTPISEKEYVDYRTTSKTCDKVELKKVITEFKKKQYLKFIKKGINFLSNNSYREYWKWLNKHAGRHKKSALNTDIKDPISKDLISETDQKLKIWSNQFHKQIILFRKSLMKTD